MIYTFLLGFLLGSLLINMYLEAEKNDNIRLEKLVDELDEKLYSANKKVAEIDELIKDYQEEHEILLTNSAELRAKIVDLENNVEFLYNNLTPKKRELVRPSNQN